MTRREWLLLTSGAACAQQTNRVSLVSRIQNIVRAYEEQGIHRTATSVDNASGDWLMAEVRDSGVRPERESFSIERIDPVAAFVRSGGRKVDGLPLFDGGGTSAEGVRGRIGLLESDAEIGVGEAPPNASAAGAIGEARRQNRHRAIVLITQGGRPGLCPNNAENFLRPYGPPVVQVSSEEKPWLDECARAGKEGLVVAQNRRTPAGAFNVLGSIAGSDPSLAPLVVMTPRSGWWSCASERVGGIVCWLEAMRSLAAEKAARPVLFVASSGHELGQLGIETYVERRPDLVKSACAWMHFGANIGAAQNPGNILQASDDDMEGLLAGSILESGMKIDRRVTRGTVPGGEAGVIHRLGGRYMSLIGSNALFHNPADLGPDAVSIEAVARFAGVFSGIAKKLAGAYPPIRRKA
jgi:hypothetical protein